MSIMTTVAAFLPVPVLFIVALDRTGRRPADRD